MHFCACTLRVRFQHSGNSFALVHSAGFCVIVAYLHLAAVVEGELHLGIRKSGSNSSFVPLERSEHAVSPLSSLETVKMASIL